MTDSKPQCGNTTTVMAREGPGGGKMPIRPKCIRDRGHDGPHSNGKYRWSNP